MTEIESEPHVDSGTRDSSRGLVWAIAALVVVGVVAIGLLVWLLARDDGSTTKATTTSKFGSVAASEDDLRALADQVDHPVYWAGPREGGTYELTRTRKGSIYIRYLPEGAEVGDPRPRFTTVGTYPSASAFATVTAGAQRKDATAYRFKSGAIAVTYAKTPSSVFFAFPNSPYLVEVFDPSPARAVKLVTSGQVQLVK
jgi:hypothetical protein